MLQLVGVQLATLLFRRFIDQFRCDLVELVPVIAICYDFGNWVGGKVQINVLKWENNELGPLWLAFRNIAQISTH